MNRDLDLGNIGRYLDAYDRHAGDKGMQNGFAFAMLKECYPEEESYDTAKRRFFATEGKSTQDVYAYFRKLYDDAKTYHGGEVKKYNANPESFTAEQESEFLRNHPYQAFLKTTRNLPQNVRDTAFGIVFAEESRSNVSEAFADKLLAMPENERNAALWGAYVLSPETSSNFFKRVGNRLLENLGDNSFNLSSYLEQSQKGVNPNTVYDAVAELDALGEDGKIKPEKLDALNKKLNELRGENSIFNEESSQVYGEKFGNLFSGNGYKADEKEYTPDFIEAEYKKGKRAKETFKLVSQLREIMRTRYEKRNIVAQTFEDATVVGVEMLKYVGASAAGTAISKNPWVSASLVGAVMYSEFKPQMFNALRHEGNMSADDANKYANFATAGMIAANYIGYTRWVKAVKPSSYLLGTEITKANARDYFFHAIAEMPKTFLREGVAETASEYMESVVEYATKSWVADHEGATFEQKQLWDNFCQDFLDTTRIMPALMFGSTLLGGGLAVNKIRRDSGVGWNFKQFVSPSEAVNHQVQAQAAMAQADAAVLKAGESLGEKSTAYDFARKYQEAKTDEERVSLLSERFGTEEERANAKAALENVDKLNDEVNRTFAQMLADAAKQNADETERLDRENQAIDGVFDEAENSQKGSPKFKIVEELLDRLDARDSVVEVNSAADLERVGYSAEEARSIMDSMGRKGFFSAEDGKIYMLPAHFKNGVDAFRTFVHERGHWLAQKIKDTPEYAGMLQRIVQITGGEEVLRSLLPSGYANDDVNVAAEEYLMRVVERVALEDVLNANQRGVWNFFKTKLKKWFGGDRTLATMADRELAEMARSIYRRATSPEGQKPTNRWEVFTPENNGKPASGIWQVVDADALITSTDKGYDDKLQPRNRQRKGSEIQTTEIAVNLNPALLGVSAKSSDGAPIIDARGMVISGNGRTLAVRKAYEAERPERAQAYKNFVSEQAERLGLDVPASFKKPMLVRRVDDLGGMSMEEFAAKSNKSDLAGMSNAENAIADARRILDAHLLDRFFPSDNGDVLAASNNDFITEFLDIVGGREEYIDKNGARKPNLAPRIKAAVLAAMLDPEKRDIIENLLDNPQGWSGLINGLFGSVANLAKLDGNADYNLADELSKAVEIFVGLQRAGESVATFNAQGDMFSEPISDEVGFLIELFEKNTRTPTGISGVLNAYYNLVKNIDTTTQDIFGAENPSKIDELRAAYQKYSTSLTEEPNASWRNTGEPTEAEIAEARRQKDEVKAKWTNPDGTMKKGYHLAPNGKESRLTEKQWLWVRTQNFKKWFGDWETLAIFNEVENMPASAIKLHESLDKAGIKEAFKSFGEVENRRDGRVVVFPTASAGKIRRHKGFDSGTVIKNFKILFETAIPAISEKEVLKDGHKAHGNIDAVEHYVNKFSANGIEYFIRFTVPVIRNNKGPENVHSSAISEVSIYKNGDSTLYPLNTAGSSSPSFVDGKLADFLNAVNKKDVSKVVDENGEPLVVYHNTPHEFTVFKPSERGRYGAGVYATSNPEDSSYGENWNMMALFANARNLRNPTEKVPVEFLRKLQKQAEDYLLKNPPELFVGKKEAMLDFYFGKNRNEIFQHSFGSFYWNNLRDILDQANKVFGSDFNIEADGFIIERDGGKWFNFFDRSQIKSATDNVGTYSENPDIRWSIREDSDAEKIDTQFGELYERYKNGEVSAEDLQKEIDAFMGDFHSERAPERKIIEYATPKEKIYDIDEAVDFVRKNLLNKPINNYVEQEGKIVSATISRNCLDKINSGKARGKTNNNRLYALAVANIDRLFTLSNRLESEPPKNGSPELKAVHRHYAPLLMDGKVYAVKLTVKEFDKKTGNRIYSIEGIDVNGESDLSGLSKNGENSDSSAAIQRSDSVKKFIDKIRNVNKKFHDLAREKISNKAYGEAAKLVADYAESKGYDVKVYHGTGADGFNVAKADASEAKNGEGAQAHGMGLYLATNKSTSERYQRKAKKSETYTVNGKAVDMRKIGEDLNLPELKVELSLSNMKHWGFNKFLQQLDSFIKKEEENLKFYEKGLDALGNPLENDSDYLVNKTKSGIEFRKQFIREFQSIREWIKENLGEDVADNDCSVLKKLSNGKLFDWFTNLKPENVLDEDKTLNEQNEEIREKFKKAFDEDILPLLKESYGFDEDEFASAMRALDFSRGVRRIVSSAKSYIGADKFNEIMLKHGIKGITYDGRRDGRCYVSFEGGAAVKLQDPFTFDDNGQLIPLSQRFDSSNPDMRWKDDTVLMPIDINVLVARNIDALMNAIRKSHKSVLAKKAELDKKYPDDDKDRKSKIQNDLRLYILENFSSELVPIAKLSDEDFKFYRKQFGIRDRFVYTSFGYAIEHYFNRHPDTPIENYLLLPDTIINPDKKKEVGKWIKDELGEWIYDASQAFVKEYDKWHVSTIKVDTQLTQSGKKLIAFKNFYGAKKEPYGNKKTIEDYWKNATSSSDSSRRQAKISTLNNFNRQGESSTDGVENQEKNSRLRFLLRQERTENPVIWASIVLAREILNGRGITRAKVEKLLPTEQFDGSKQNYAVERAQRIAEKTKATQKQFSKDLDIAIRKAESNLYWQDEFVENAYRAFSKGGEEYGFAKQRLMQYLKDLRNKELNKVKGYETDDFDVDLVDAILKAQEAEPERAAGDESKSAGEEAEEELEESGGAFEGDEELSGKKTPLAPSKIRDVIGAIRREVVKRVRNSDGDQKTLDEKYRKTLVNVLTDAMKELVYGKEREDIGRKIEELKNVKHAVITVKGGERVGQKIDNFTLRAENIALRIFKRGVRDSKKLMTEKLDAILKRRGKKPSRMQRDDKRSMTGLVQQRIYNISRYVEMDAEALEDVRREAVEKLENIDENFVQDAEKGKIREDVEDVRAEVANVLHDIEMFGGWADKSRAEMAQALEFLEQTIDTETAAQKERVEKRKERNGQIRKIISDALKMAGHNAARDGGMRVAIRKVLNGSLPFDSFLGLLGESATGETRKLFEEWRKDFVARVDRAANAKANEVFQTQQKFIKLVEDSYLADFHDALKRLLEKKGEYEQFSKPVDGMRQPMSLANVIQLYVSAAQKNYERNIYEHRAARSPEYKKLQDEIDEIQSKFPERADKTGAEWEDAKARIDELEKKQAQMREEALADYLKSIEALLSDGDKRFIEGLRQLYKDALPSISAVVKRVIGLPIEQADALYMPVKVKRSGNLGEGVPQVPVVPKSLSQRVPHLRDLDETADPISLFTDRISENAQFKHFSELYIEMRGIFGDGDLQDLIKQRCGADVLKGLKEFIADIATGKTRGPQNELLRKTNGLTAVMLLGFNLGSGIRQVLPGVAAFAPAIGGGKVFKNMMSFFTPEGFAAAREICRSDTGRRRFEIGNMQIMEELLSTPDRNRFWAAYKRHALFFNRFADKLSIMFIGQGIYRSGVEEYLRKGFSEAEAKRLAMSDMWQIAERTQASGRIHNMSLWQRRGGEYGKALGLFSSPPQLMFSMAYAKCRRALALGVKTPEGRAAVWDALSTLFYVSVCVEGSYALSGVLWNAALKGFFDDDDGEQILKQMALGPFGGLFIFGRIIEGAGSNYGTSLAPIEQLSRPIRHTKNLLFDAGQFDADKALEDLDKLAKSLFPLYRDGKKLYENRMN